MMKKRILKTIAGVVCVMTIMSTTAFADTNSKPELLISSHVNIPSYVNENSAQIELISQKDIIEQFVTETGIVSEIIDKDNYKMIHIENDDMGMVFNVAGDVFVIDQKSGNTMKITDIKKDMKITAILPEKAPMTMSIPPQTSSAVGFIINNGDEKVEISEYKEFLPEVTIEEEVKEDKYIELRAEAEAKGYKVEWSSNNKPIILTKNDMKIEISIGSNEFTFTHRTRDIKPLDRMESLSKTAILEDGKTMVPSSFIEALV